MKFTAALFTLALLVATDVKAQCLLGGNCMDDPKAWEAMFGNSPAQRAEQANARRAAESLVLQERQQNNAALVADMGQAERRTLTYSLEDTLTRLSGAPAVVLRATVLARGGGYLFCGSALYGQTDSGIFILDTRPSGPVALNASKEAFVAAGCGAPATILR